MNFFKDNRGFAIVATAIILPFIFGLCAVSFDLSIALKNQSRLHDALREAVFITSIKDDDEMVSKIEKLSKTYLNDDDKKIDNIEITKKRDNNEENQRASFIKISADIENNGIFTKFVNNIEKKSSNSYAKIELKKDLGYTDFIFAMAFTGSANDKTGLIDKERLCKERLIDNGICNPPTGEGQIIDAVQTIVANIIKMAKTFDKENNQNFGFIPYSAGVQVKGKNLSDDLLDRIDTKDGLDKSERDEATYVIWPLELFSPLNFKNLDIYSRFYPLEILQAGNSVLREKVITKMRALGLDTFAITHNDISEFVFERFKLKPENLSDYEDSDFNDAQEFINTSIENQAVGDPDSYNKDNKRVQITLDNIFNDKRSVVYRLYNPNVDVLKMKTSQADIVRLSQQFNTANSQYQNTLADLTILDNAEKKVGEIDLKLYEQEYRNRSINFYDDLYKEIYIDFITGGGPNDGTWFGWYRLESAIGTDGADEFQFAFEDLKSASGREKKSKEYKKIAELYKKYPDAVTKANIPILKPEPKIDANTPVPPPSLNYIVNVMLKDKEKEYRQRKTEYENLNSNGVIGLCTNTYSPPSPRIYELYCKPNKQLIENFSTVKKEYEKVQEEYNSLSIIVKKLSGEASITIAQQRAKLLNLKSELFKEVQRIKSSLDQSFEIKGKALCNSAMAFVAGAACQTKSAGALNFFEINPIKIKDIKDIKDIKPINEQPFDIQRGIYQTAVGPEHDYASIGLIRSALMLSRNKKANSNAKILLFTSSVNKSVDENLFKAGLCQKIINDLKSKHDINAEIYAITLGLPKDDNRIVSLNKYKKLWSQCTPNIITADNLNDMIDQIQKDVFKGTLGKITYDIN